MTEEGKYLYCIIEEKQPKKFGIKGVEGKEVYNVCYDGLSAVVSDSEIKEYLITRENLLTHQKVIEEIFKKYEVLPVSFGTVAKSSEEIKGKILKPKDKELRKILKEIRGKIELGLKILWSNMDSVFQEIANHSLKLQAIKSSQNISYQDRIAAGQLVSVLLEEKREEEKEIILKPLKKIADDFKENKNLGENMIFNGVFLVSKNKEKKFDREINALGEKYGPRIKFMYIGPLPLFNFINIK